MLKISWNDINDSDSSLSSDHDEPETAPKSIKQPSARSDNKLKNACDKLSLSKLDTHEKDDVWLFVPNSFYQQADKVNSILENCKKLKKLIRAKGVGWNILTDYDQARLLILEGINQEGILIRFIYSTRNDSKSCLHEQKGFKVQKKVTYVQKVDNSPQLMRTFSTNQELPKKEDKIVSMRQLREEKPKVRWLEKNINLAVQIDKSSNYNEDQKVESPLSMSPRSPKSFTNLKEIKSPKKYVQKEKPKYSENIQKQEKTEIEKKEEPVKTGEEKIGQQSVLKETHSEETMEVQSPKPTQPLEIEKEQEQKEKEKTEEKEKREENIEEKEERIEVLSDENSDVEVEQKKKKNKKKKKAKNGAKVDQRDPNNPFSFFAQ